MRKRHLAAVLAGIMAVFTMTACGQSAATGGDDNLVIKEQGMFSAGGTVTEPVENISAITAIEPGGAPEPGSEQYQKLLNAKIPVVIYFGDYIDNGPEDIMSTSFWAMIRDGAVAFAEQYNADGGDATVVELPKEGITGNSHFMFQELNNEEIADHMEAWLKGRGLTE